MPIGVIVNCISVLAGGVIGSALGHVLPNSLKEHLPTLFGMCSIAIGINSIIKAVSMTAVVLAILVGFTIGHLLHLEDWASRCRKALPTLRAPAYKSKTEVSLGFLLYLRRREPFLRSVAWRTSA